jgi:hypothetical protein
LSRDPALKLRVDGPIHPEGRATTMSDEASRRHHRVPVDVRVHVASIDAEVDPRTGDRAWRDSEERCSNLSVGGALIRTLDPPLPGQRLLLRIHVGAGETIERTGRVAWSRHVVDTHAGSEHGVGIVFEEPSDPGLHSFLDRSGEDDRSVG